MRELTPYGGGLNVLITCENRPGHDWMSFVSWYSMRQFLPDAKVVVSCKRGNFEMLKWCPRQRVQYFVHNRSADPLSLAMKRSYVDNPLILIKPEYVVNECLPEDLMERLLKDGSVRDLSEWCLPAKDPNLQSFSSIAEGCGGFQLGRWIDNGGNPLGYAERFLKGSLTAGERKVLNLWCKATPLYENIG